MEQHHIHLIAENGRIPTQLASWEKKNIVQGRVKGMRVCDPEKALTLILPVDNDILRPSDLLSITNNYDSNLIGSGIGKIVAALVTIFIKVKGDAVPLIRAHPRSDLICLSIKLNCRVGGVKHVLQQTHCCTVQRIGTIRTLIVTHTAIKGMISVMDVELGKSGRIETKWDNGASIVNELATQNIGERPMTILVDSMLHLLASRSHGQGIVVLKDVGMKCSSNRVIASEKMEKFMWHLLKGRKRDLASRAARAKDKVVNSGCSGGLSAPMKSMARRTFNSHLTKAVNFPSRIKGLACNGKVE